MIRNFDIPRSYRFNWFYLIGFSLFFQNFLLEIRRLSWLNRYMKKVLTGSPYQRTTKGKVEGNTKSYKNRLIMGKFSRTLAYGRNIL